MKYSEIQSEYIKKKIQETSWSEHEKIDELICLYKYIRQPPVQYNSGWHFGYLKSHYAEEYLELLREFSLEAYQIEIAKLEEIKLKISKQAQIAEDKEIKLKHEWIKSGGKP